MREARDGVTHHLLEAPPQRLHATAELGELLEAGAPVPDRRDDVGGANEVDVPRLEPERAHQAE
jgi:hypothetical protein